MINFFKKKKTFFLNDSLKEEIKKNFAEIESWSYGNPKVYRWNYTSRIKIGKFCSIGPEVNFLIGSNHHLKWITTSPLSASYFNDSFPNCSNIDLEKKSGDLVIMNDVWIGAFSTIFDGVEIGNGSIIGAGSVIRKNVEPYSVVVGNPQIVLKKRFSEDKIKILEDSKWWKLKDDQINIISPYLLSEDFEGFISALNKIKS